MTTGGPSRLAGPGDVRLFGDAAVMVTTAGPDATRHLAEQLRRERPPGVVDVVGGLRTVLVVVDPHLVDPAALRPALAAASRHPPAPPAPSRTVTVPVAFDGPDLEDVAATLGLDPAGLVRSLCSARLRVAMLGFSPGFAYLDGLPEPLGDVRRRSSPRAVVPAGSLALAGGFAAVYPQATPGGWQLVGRTALPMFDPATPPHALLAPGDAVVLEPVAPAPGAWWASPPQREHGRRPWRVSGGDRHVLTVGRPGLLTTVQDGGRRGSAHIGVPSAGPADPVAHRLANRLVGNPDSEATVEITAQGPTLRCVADTYVAVVGGAPTTTLDGRPVEEGRVVPVSAGQHLSVGATTSGLRTYLAVPGGVVVPSVMGSRSTDTLGWVGPGPLTEGDQLAAGRRPVRLADHLAPQMAAPAGVRVVRVVPGPHPEWFPAAVVEALAASRFTVVDPGRVGVRLRVHGEPLRRRPGDLESQGMVTGAVQVPPDGQPIVLLADHVTVGGYPVVAVVISADLSTLGQCRTGDELRLVPVTQAEATRARRDLDRWLATAVTGRYPTVPG